MSSLKCAVCNKSASQKCGGCQLIVYCGKEHQKDDWKRGHRNACKCFEVSTNEQLGRHLVATRDIKRGEIILTESPIVVGPKTACYPTCLGCHKRIFLKPNEKFYYKCKICNWPMCNKNCEKSIYHKNECDLMKKKNFKYKMNYDGDCCRESGYCVIAPMRCLLLKMDKPDAFKKILDLESHLDERIKTPIYNTLRANVVTFLSTILGLTEFSERTIMEIVAILDTNTFEIRLSKLNINIRGIFLLAAMMSHDCRPNTKHVFNDDLQIILIAATDIKKKSPITASYTQSLQGTIQRRAHLKQSKYFDCICERCKDETEFGTFMAGILCPHCQTGKVVPTEPLDNDSIWKCHLCLYEVEKEQILIQNQMIMTEVQKLVTGTSQEFEDFISKYKYILHPQNTHILQAKYALTQLYRNVSELTEPKLERKIVLCKELLDVGDKIEPGSSHFRGLLLLDLHKTQFTQIKRQYVQLKITKDEFKQNIKDLMVTLQEAIEILKYDSGMKDLLQKHVITVTSDLNDD